MADRVQWADGRPVGVFNYADPTWRTTKNPRGWNPHFFKDLDAADPDYYPKFADIWMKFNSDGLVYGKEMGCQGGLAWDIEGAQYDHWTTYLGDPIQTRPPEVTIKMLQWFAAESKKYGMWLGFTLRPTYALVMAHNICNQVPVGDPDEVLIWKKNLIKNFLGDNVIADYCDSNNQVTAWVKPGDPAPLSPNIFKTVRSVFPNHVSFVEFKTLAYTFIPGVVPIRFPNQPSNDYQELVMPEASDRVYGTMEKIKFISDFKNNDIPAVTLIWKAPWNEQLLACYEAAKTSINPTTPVA